MKPGKTACPPPEKFEKFFRNECRLHEGERLVNHALNCPVCRVRFDVLREVNADIRGRLPEFAALAAASLDETRVLRRKTSGKAGGRFVWSRPRAVVTAILLLVAGTTAFLVVQNRIAGNIVRGRGDAALKLIYPRGLVTAAPNVLRWSRPAGAEYFFIELVDDRLNVIFPRASSKTDFYDLPPEVAGRLEKGRTYIWSIEAFDDLMRKIATGQADFQIEIKR